MLLPQSSIRLGDYLPFSQFLQRQPLTLDLISEERENFTTHSQRESGDDQIKNILNVEHGGAPGLRAEANNDLDLVACPKIALDEL